MTDDDTARASRLEAAEAGAHHETAEARAGLPVREHVTAGDSLLRAHPHHPDDPNDGVVRMRTGSGALLAAAVAAAVTIVAVVLLALATRGAA